MKDGIKITPAIVMVILLAGSIITAVVLSQDTEAEWETNVFDEVIKVTRTPDHINDRAPMNGEPMHLEITTKNNKTINAADVRFSWIYGGETSAKGGYAFSRIDQTTMEVEIPGYPGGYEIQYEILVYDENNRVLQSTLHSYKVVKNGSWMGNDFETNIMMEWGPKEPKIGESITINIESRNPLVTMERADLFYTANIPGQDPLEGVDFFKRVNGTVMTYELVPYPAGSRISFNVEAYDTYFDSVTSPRIVFEYPLPPVIGPVYTGIIFVTLMDEKNGIPVDGEDTIVQFYNDTYLYETSPTNGVVFTNQTVYQGTYKMKVLYKGEEYVFDLNVPRLDGSFTFSFNVNEETFSVDLEDEERPAYLELVGVLLMVILSVTAFSGAVKAKSIREAINKRKRETRKAKKIKEEEPWVESLYLNEEKKKLVIRTLAFAVLSLLGLFWAPFYPWWAVLLFAGFVTAISWKLPYISMLVLSILVTASAAYQSNEFGWVFLVFTLVVMIGGFFDWRFAYLSFLTIFLAGYGFGFVVPVIASVTISLFLGTVVLITAGVLMLVIAPSGNFTWLGFLASPEHEKSFVTFSRSVENGWSPVDIVNEIGGMAHADTGLISTVLVDTMGSVIPFFGILGWAAAMVAAYVIMKKWESGDIDLDIKKWGIRAVPGVIVAIFGIISILWANIEFTVWTFIALAGCVPASISAFGLRALGEEALPLEYGMEEIKRSDIGKKVSEMLGFREASFNEIGGLADVKREVKNALMVPLLEPEMATRYDVKPSKGLMLFGPPGCGKTLMLRAVASDLNVDMIGIKCSDVMSKWYGESENLIASLFEEARSRSPCILFLDEIDAIAKRRDFYSTDDVTPRVLSIMLSEMDGMDEAEGIIIVATTNMPDLVDPALMRPGRFDKVIYVPPPDEVSRQEILKVHMKGKFVADDIDVKEMARRTKGFSGADLANLVREASSLGLERALETRKPQPITMEDMRKVLDEIKPSISSKMIRMYDKLRKEFERKKKRKQDIPSDKEDEKASEIPPGKNEKVYDLEEIEDMGEWEGDD